MCGQWHESVSEDLLEVGGPRLRQGMNEVVHSDKFVNEAYDLRPVNIPGNIVTMLSCSLGTVSPDPDRDISSATLERFLGTYLTIVRRLCLVYTSSGRMI